MHIAIFVVLAVLALAAVMWALILSDQIEATARIAVTLTKITSDQVEALHADIRKLREELRERR